MPIGNSSSRCEPVAILSLVFDWAILTIWAVLSAFRVHAFSQRRLLTILTLLLGLTPVVEDMVFNFTRVTYIIVHIGPVNICEQHLAFSERDLGKGLIACRACAIVSDLIVLAATWHGVHHSRWRRDWRRSLDGRPSLTGLLAIHGTLYFLFVLLLYIADMIYHWLYSSDALQAFITPMLSILISRFILSIRNICYTGTTGNIFDDSSLCSADQTFTLPVATDHASMVFADRTSLAASYAESEMTYI
ncbi:hypothetical protein WOLCODRAFT_29554 [Wolfiporia cocos MD-104 SS10]|uniref:Uncharacterized protein n=1 Tax=Wolfiporia cocos (strain MD-104) TaxID=742152 RepID=A0A2H3JB00_WOLCO|nr:hypothetical protein WOLCODRAFT_29554 [Wolfiporia cocos MD-104 SS10]